MRIVNLRVKNFRAISALELDGLTDVVVLAGPNGCGKSCVLDAIRLLKSAYGSYQQDEWQTWFGEFQINVAQDSKELALLFQNRMKPLSVAAAFILAETEKEYLRANLAGIIEDRKWAELDPGFGKGRRTSTSFASIQRTHGAQIARETQAELEIVLTYLDRPQLEAEIILHSEGRPELVENPLLESIFRTYEPANLGVIDYHSANRNYARERIGNINLTIEGDDQRLKQHALYNSAGKYANLKSQMAGAYVRHLLAREANESATLDDTLTESLKELFSTFFPGKEFLGPQPTNDGRLLFPVRLSNGAEHDIDELSSGEKEVLYGYLRLRSAAPKNSIIMIDEPELHLNPRLVTGLASFYHRHIGGTLGNQLWLITHSDTLIRETVSRGEFSVFHVQPSGGDPEAPQASRVRADAELERLVIDLVGDLAAYRPGARVVIFESTDDAAFDARMTCSLFPELRSQINPISGGDKERVKSLYDVLERARVAGQLHIKFFAITDPDDSPETGSATTRLEWDAYHIENYLLEPRYILQVCRELNIRSVKTEQDILARLVEAARATVSELVAHKLRAHVNRHLVSSLDLRVNPTAHDVTAAMVAAVAASNERLQRKLENEVSASEITAMEKRLRGEYSDALADGSWVRRFRGRDILKGFVQRVVSSAGTGVQYEPFRDLVVARMQDAKHKPLGMQAVVDRILGS